MIFILIILNLGSATDDIYILIILNLVSAPDDIYILILDPPLMIFIY